MLGYPGKEAWPSQWVSLITIICNIKLSSGFFVLIKQLWRKNDACSRCIFSRLFGQTGGLSCCTHQSDQGVSQFQRRALTPAGDRNRPALPLYYLDASGRKKKSKSWEITEKKTTVASEFQPKPMKSFHQIPAAMNRAAWMAASLCFRDFIIW